MTSNKTIAVYGAYGHTGRFVVAELQKRGWISVISGRNAEKLNAFAAENHRLEMRPVSVENSDSLDRALDGAAAVINCAGPFAETAAPVIEAALRAKIPYLDVAAEVEVVADVFEQFQKRARAAEIVIVPSMAFYGGLGDLLATAAMGDWYSADEINLAFALDSWKPTIGTRRTSQTSKRRRNNQRLVYANGRMELRGDAAPLGDWDFPQPFGKQTVVGEFTTADSVTISQHLKASKINTFMTAAPLKDLSDPNSSTPTATDESGRSSQIFLVEAAVMRSGGEKRRAVAGGRDIYHVTAPLVVEAVERVLKNPNQRHGVFAAGEIFDAADFLKSLSPEYLSLEIFV